MELRTIDLFSEGCAEYQMNGSFAGSGDYNYPTAPGGPPGGDGHMASPAAGQEYPAGSATPPASSTLSNAVHHPTWSYPHRDARDEASLAHYEGRIYYSKDGAVVYCLGRVCALRIT